MQALSTQHIIRMLFWAGIGLFVVWFLLSSGLMTSVVLFFMAGVVPGTNFSIPPVWMFAILALCVVAVGYWLHREKLGSQIKAMKAEHQQKYKPAAKRKTATRRKTTSSKTALSKSSAKDSTQRPKAPRSRPTTATRRAKTAGSRRK